MGEGQCEEVVINKRKVVEVLIGLACGRIPTPTPLLGLIPELQGSWRFAPTPQVVDAICRALGIED